MPTWWGAVVSDTRYPALNEANYARVEARRPKRGDPVAFAALLVLRGTAYLDHVVTFPERGGAGTPNR
jgi:hypothetical protein